MQQKIYGIYVFSIKIKKRETKKEVFATPSPTYSLRMDTFLNSTNDRFKKNPANGQALVKFKNQVISMNENTKPAKEYSFFEQYQYLRRCSINEGAIARQYEEKREKIESEAAEDIKEGVNDLEVTKTKAESFTQLEMLTNEIHFSQGIIFNAKVYVVLATLLANEITVENEIRQDEVQEGKSFWVKFRCDIEREICVRKNLKKINLININSMTPFDEMDKDTARVVFNKLHNTFGPVATDRFLFNATKKELSVCFETLDVKKKCLESNVIPGIGKPTIFVNQGTMAYVQENWTIYIDMVVEGTTEDMIWKPFKDAGIEPKSIGYKTKKKLNVKLKIIQPYRRYEDQAYINLETQEDMINGLKLRKVKINRRTHNLVPGRNFDLDSAKGILGFFEGRTTAPGELYQHIDTMESMNPLVAQPTMWKKYLNKRKGKRKTLNKDKKKSISESHSLKVFFSESLKHCYFLMFENREALMEAVFRASLKIGNEVLQVYPIQRDRVGHLIFPVEGTWKAKRTRPMEVNGNTTQEPAARRNRTQPTNVNISFDLIL
jgi:hypothetical protein